MNCHADDCEEQLLESHPGTLIDLQERNNMIQLAGAHRQALAHFYALHHVGVFPSIHPEPFEIVCRRNDGVWASRGEKQCGRDRQTGRRWQTRQLFKAGESKARPDCLIRISQDANLSAGLLQASQQKAQQRLSVVAAAEALKAGFRLNCGGHSAKVVL